MDEHGDVGVAVDEHDPLARFQRYTLTVEEVAMYGDPEWAEKNLLIDGMLHAIVSDPGGGKTTIATWIAGRLAEKGYEVIYTLADIGKTGVAHYHAMSVRHGWTLLLPDIKPGLSMMDVVEDLQKLNDSVADLSGRVFFFDTLKKMTDVINKRQVKKLFNLLRSLTAKGAMVVLLGHTNKYVAENGEPIFEGTHDIKTDSDNLIYLIPLKHPDKSMTVSTKPSDKVRGAFEPITFEIGADRSVRLAEEFVDTLGISNARRQREEDEDLIEFVTFKIRSGVTKQSDLIAAGNEHEPRISRRQMRRVLKAYARPPLKLWDEVQGVQHNVVNYFLPKTQDATPF